MDTQLVSPELQQADDLMVALVEQRNVALNNCAQLQAELRAAKRRIAELEKVVEGQSGTGN